MMEIELINRIIVQAVLHGADAGGSYDSNNAGLTKAIMNFLITVGIADEFCVRDTIINGMTIPQITRRL